VQDSGYYGANGGAGGNSGAGGNAGDGGAGGNAGAQYLTFDDNAEFAGNISLGDLDFQYFYSGGSVAGGGAISVVNKGGGGGLGGNGGNGGDAGAGGLGGDASIDSYYYPFDYFYMLYSPNKYYGGVGGAGGYGGVGGDGGNGGIGGNGGDQEIQFYRQADFQKIQIIDDEEVTIGNSAEALGGAVFIFNHGGNAGDGGNGGVGSKGGIGGDGGDSFTSG
jgi:hypothetical protein